MRVPSLFVAVVILASCSSGSGSAGSGGAGGGGGSGGGTGGGGGGGGQCPDIAGTWTIQSHCDSSQVGAQVVVTQSGCTATSEGLSIPLAADGSFAIDDKLPDGTPISCTGTASESSITENCTVGGQQCAITLGK